MIETEFIIHFIGGTIAVCSFFFVRDCVVHAEWATATAVGMCVCGFGIALILV